MRNQIEKTPGTWDFGVGNEQQANYYTNNG